MAVVTVRSAVNPKENKKTELPTGCSPYKENNNKTILAYKVAITQKKKKKSRESKSPLPATRHTSWWEASAQTILLPEYRFEDPRNGVGVAEGDIPDANALENGGRSRRYPVNSDDSVSK